MAAAVVAKTRRSSKVKTTDADINAIKSDLTDIPPKLAQNTSRWIGRWVRIWNAHNLAHNGEFIIVAVGTNGYLSAIRMTVPQPAI
jgi:hypothetical protein